MKIKISELKLIIITILSKENYSHEEAEKIAEVYIFAETTGKNTQGILKLMGTEPAQNIKPKYAPKIVKETSVSLIMDGGGAAGPLPAQETVDQVIKKASEHGFAIAGMNNIFSSTGAISYYAHKMAKNNLIGIVAAGSPRSVAFFEGAEPVFGTNPIAFGFPTNQEPIVFDMATSAMTFYGLVKASALGQNIPENIALDKDGNPTINPDEAIKGSLLPFDRSYKGSGLGLIVELLTGPLTGAQYVFSEGDWGMFFLAFSPNLLGNIADFKDKASDLVRKVKKAKTKSGKPVHIPGYDTFEKMQQTIDSDGVVEIDQELLTKLRSL